MKFDFDEIFSFPVRAMKINQSHPDIKRNKRWVLRIILGHSIFSIFFVFAMYNIIFHNLKHKDFNETCKNGVFAIVYSVVTYQFGITLWKRDLLKEIIQTMKNDYAVAQNLTKDDQEIVLKYAKNGVYVCKQWLLISSFTCGVFFIKNLILLTYYWAKGNPRFIQVYDMIYPGIIEEKKDNNIFVYLFIYVFMLFYGVYSICTYTAFVPLGPSFMLHACGQLELVEKKIQGLFLGDLNDVEEKLKEIVKQLQKIYGFVDKVNLTVQEAYELTFKGTAILIPVTLYEVLESVDKGELPLEFITFIIGGVLISSSPCYHGELLMEKGENVRLAIYACGWEAVYNPKWRSTICIMLNRALRPTAIRTFFRIVSLETLSDIFKQAYTIFNLMNAMWN